MTTAPRQLGLAKWLRIAHLYETWHQLFRLAFYVHPFRFGAAIYYRDKTPPDLGQEDPLDIDLEQACLVLATIRPIGATLPSAFRGSDMPCLASAWPTLGAQEGATLIHQVRQPDWRDLYFSTLTLWAERSMNGKETFARTLQRELVLPREWIPIQIRDKHTPCDASLLGSARPNLAGSYPLAAPESIGTTAPMSAMDYRKGVSIRGVLRGPLGYSSRKQLSTMVLNQLRDFSVAFLEKPIRAVDCFPALAASAFFIPADCRS